MSQTRVKTKYEVSAPWGATEERTLYCVHYHGSDTVSFYDEEGNVVPMVFEHWSMKGKDLWDAMNVLWSPYKNHTSDELEDGVEHFNLKEIGK